VASAAGHTRDSVQLRRLSRAASGFILTLWTADAALATRADAAGIDRIGVDLERLGKRARQRGRGTWISPHSEEDLAAVGAALSRAELFARTDPLHDGTAGQVERLLELGAEVLMLPMFRTAEEVERFVALVDGRARVVLLLETTEAAGHADEIASVPGVEEIHLGLNDLSIEMRLANRFSLLATDLAAEVAEAVTARGVRFGAGGIGRVGDAGLPVPGDLVYAQFARLGASAALISRSFLAHCPEGLDLGHEVRRSRERLAEWACRPADELDAARRELSERAGAAAGW
jgi:HpcH/HpaI aldolase/citrate lyase family